MRDKYTVECDTIKGFQLKHNTFKSAMPVHVIEGENVNAGTDVRADASKVG
jgi:hypothetical protein